MNNREGAWRHMVATAAALLTITISAAEAAPRGRATANPRFDRSANAGYVMSSDVRQARQVEPYAEPGTDMQMEQQPGPYVDEGYQGQSCGVGSCGVGCCDGCNVGCDGCNESCDGCAPGCRPVWAHRTGVWGEALYLHTTGVDMAHAQQQDGIGGAGTVPFGQIGTADPDYDIGVRVGGGVALSDCSSLVASYTFFETDARSFIEAPVVGGGGGAVGSLVHHPGTALTASAGPVEAFYDIDFQMADAEFRSLLWGSRRGWVNYSAGGRYAHLEQDFIQNGIFGGGLGGLINTTSGIEFDGGGALFGLDGERLIGCKGFSFYGNAGVAPVVGQFSSTYRMTNQTTDTDLALVQWKDDRVVAIVDYELGLAWTGPRGHVRFSAGYLAQHWFNTITTAELINSVQANNYTGAGETLSFDGLVTRVEVRF